MRSALYTGSLVHARSTPVANAFRYRLSFYVLDLDELPELERRLTLFSVNRPNLVSLYDRDHLDDDGLPLKQKVLAFLGERGIDLAGGRVLMLAQLRVAGYVFNPVSFFWCYRPDGTLAAMVAELNNTFGERLPQLLSPANQIPGNGGGVSYLDEKRLHVSPFMGLDQSYRYTFSEPGERVYARIDVLDRDGSRRLRAVLAGERRPLTNRSLAIALLRYPLMPAQVTALIHWQALRLWLKRVPFHHKPPFVPGEGSVRT